MKAAVLKARGREGVVVEPDWPDPVPKADQALVRVLAASINRVDLYMRDSGAGITHTLPQVMGIDGVGEVISAPPGAGLAEGTRVVFYPYELCGHCRGCRAGDQPLCRKARIFGEHRDGTFAEKIAVPVICCMPIPSSTDIGEAACLGSVYLTAWRMIFGKAPVGPGQLVLVQGAGGGVAYAAMQLAQMAGARVIVTTTGAEKLAHFDTLGVPALDYRNDDIPKRVLELTDGEGVDLVVDTVGEATWANSLRSLCRGGAIVTCGATTGSNPPVEVQRMFIRQLAVYGSTMGSLEEFRRLLLAWQEGHFRPHIDERFSLDQVPQALDRLEDPQRLGKLVVDVAQ